MRKSELAKRLSIFLKIGVKYYSLFSKKRLQSKFDRSKYTLGYFGYYKRYCIVKNLAISCGDNVAIFDNVVMNSISNMTIGSNVTINTGCYLDAHGGIQIGDNVGIAHGVSILTTNHKFENTQIPIGLQGISEGKVVINDDVWIGCRSTILMNSTIGTGSVVGSGSVVTKNVEPYTVSVGVPAKVIRLRK